ncbi:MAG: NAD(P)/FAD-dependent oxidoreductase [Treponema sp.]|jgi:NADH dehydrogenase|nr:NAD(P)/FAD-dependent oxidoreductase [Treponema sp.]
MGGKILIIGGGYAGIAAAKKLAAKFKKQDDIAITVVDKQPFHTLMTELHEVAGRRVEPASVRIPYSKIFSASKVTVKLDAITSIDFKKKQAASETASYPYDYLILGAGAEPEFFGIPGVKENSFTLWSYDDAMKLRFHLDAVFEKAVAEPDPEKQKKALTFVVAGAGFTGIEMAGELLEWRDEMCQKWLIDKSKVRIVIVEAMPSILPIFEKDLAGKIEAYLKKHDVELMTGTAITGAEPGVVKLKTGAALETSTFIWTAGVTGNGFADSLGLSAGPFGKNPPDPSKKNRKGRLLVTNEMRSVDYPDVFAVGDNLWFIEDGKPLPQIVETAIQTGATAAENIIADIEGKPAKQFKSDYHGFMVSVGGKYAVSNAMGIKLSGIFAQAMKHFVNLHYLIGIAGINQCWEYIKHEFLDIETHRSFVRGFGAYKSRGYWALPLRLWVGLMWVFEGVNKIGEGWLAWSSGSKSTWMFSSWIIQAGSDAAQAGDAATAASGAVTAASGAADAVSAASGAVDAAAGAVGAAASQFKAVWDLTNPIFDSQGAVATWFRTTFMDGIMSYIPFQGFQLMVVLVEIAIGLCMIGGLFTWLAGAISIAMCLVFTLSGMFEWYKVWFIFTGFLLLGGAGRAFGLDCWVIPFFKKWWNGTYIARKFYLYFDGNSK